VRRSHLLVPVLAAAIAAPCASRLAAQMPDVDPVRVEKVAEKLGVKLQVNSPRDLEFGKSVTASLEDPKKLASLGIKTMHEGARVTITCVGPSRIRVEADEMEPVVQREFVMLTVSEEGTLKPAPAPQKPASKPPF
jgi:hypothetical protein